MPQRTVLFDKYSMCEIAAVPYAGGGTGGSPL